MFHTCVSVWKVIGYTHVIIGLAVIKIRNIKKSLISLVGLHFLAAQHLQPTLHNQHVWHHNGKVPAIKLVLGVAILTHRTSFLTNNVITTKAHYSVEWPVNPLSVSWFVSEMSVKLPVPVRATVPIQWPYMIDWACIHFTASACIKRGKHWLLLI